MSKIDLTNVPAEHRASLEAQIKADREDAIKSRLARVKEDEVTTQKLKDYEELKIKVEAQTAEAKAKTKLEEDAKYLKESGLVKINEFDDLKISDEFKKLDNEEDRVEFISKLKESKPSLFEEELNALDFNTDFDNGKNKDEPEGSLII